MFKKKIVKISTIICFFVTLLFTAAFIVGDIIAYQYSDLITAALGGSGANFSGEGVENAERLGDELCQDIEEEGIVLLKNSVLNVTNGKKSLPLEDSVRRVNIFGWHSTYFHQKGVGSGSSTINDEKSIDLLQAFTNFGIEYNARLANDYKNLFPGVKLYEKNQSSDYNLYQPTLAWHEERLNYAKLFSDVAIIVISRVAGENIGEIPLKQSLFTESVSETVTDRTYLQLTKHEESLINLCRDNFSNVILIVNSSNPMHLNILETNKIDSCISVGITGQSGANAIPRILWGYKLQANANSAKIEVSPSGKLSDIYEFDSRTSPSFANYIEQNKHIQYLEDIYYGYRWYETADQEHYWEGINNEYGVGYEGVVQFPFGYGLSYTEFDWTDVSCEVSNKDSSDHLSANSVVDISVTVTNTGDYSGKDVVEIYLNPSYKKGEIEKSASVLVGFAKTEVLAPGHSETLHIKIDAYQFASYDCYDRNNNGFYGYEIDYAQNGVYQLNLMTDSHTKKVNRDESVLASIDLTVPSEGIRYATDPTTGEDVQNRLTTVTGVSTAYAGVPIDGSTVGASTRYLTRDNFASTFPSSHAATPTSTGNAEKYYNHAYDTDVMPNTNPVDNGLRLVTRDDVSAKLKANLDLMRELNDYDSPTWDQLLDQMSISELITLHAKGAFQTSAVESIGKPRALDTDGPAGFNYNTASIGESNTKWTAYPSETLIGCTWNTELTLKMGLCMGLEGQATGVQGWYAPGVNLHRTPYTARNYEYYSEDPLLSGELAGTAIQGAKINGLYCYLKHFVLSEPGPNPRELNTWCTEQNLRENYLKPFEIAVKKYGANAIMSAFNRVGSVWAGASYPCLTLILRNEWGFDGSVITDYVYNSSGVGNMNFGQGVRAGNDLWLAPYKGDESNYLSSNDPTDVACARRACKNILYTYINTYVYGNDVDYEALLPYHLYSYKANVGIKVAEAPSAWWIPTLIIAESVIMAALLVWVFFAVRGIVIRTKAYNAANATTKEKVQRGPFYVTKTMRRVVVIIASLGSLTALLLVTLIPLFNDILVSDSGSEEVVQNPVVDPGPPYDTILEFEDAEVDGDSVDSDHLCLAKSYFFNPNLSGSITLDNLQRESTITFKFNSDKAFYTVMDIGIASRYDEEIDDWVDDTLGNNFTVTMNGKELDVADIVIKKSNYTLSPSGTNSKTHNIRNVSNIPITLWKGANTLVFTTKEGCSALDYVDIRTSAFITDFKSSLSGITTNYGVKVTQEPTKTKAGKIEFDCNDACEESFEFTLPALNRKNGYKENTDLDTFELTVLGKKIVFTPSASGTGGTVHSSSKVVALPNGENFFDGSTWNHAYNNSSDSNPSYKYGTYDLINQFGEIVLDKDHIARRKKVFIANKTAQCPATDFSGANNKGYLNHNIHFGFEINTTKGFTIGAFGLPYTSQDYTANNGRAGFFFTFDDNGKVSLTIGTDPGDKTSSTYDIKKSFQTAKNIVSVPNSGFIFGAKNIVQFDFCRKTEGEFVLALVINGNKIVFPDIPSDAATGDIHRRYIENGTIHVIHDSVNTYQWGDHVSFAPNAKLTISDLIYFIE